MALKRYGVRVPAAPPKAIAGRTSDQLLVLMSFCRYVSFCINSSPPKNARRTVDLGVIGWRDLVEPAGQTPARTRLPASISLCGAADDDHHGDVVTLACITHKGADMREHAILDVLSRTPQLGTNNLPQPIFVEESLLGLLRLGDAILYRKTTHLPGAM